MTLEPPDDGFAALMDKVERERGFGVGGYKQTCLRRRVQARMRLRGAVSFAGYAALLDRDSHEFDKLVDALTINVTRFFRNAAVWEQIASQVVDPLWHSEEPELRVWSAGCATGEEAYSIAMLFHRLAAVNGMLSQMGRVRILGTDLDRGALAAAEAAQYPAASLSEVPAELRERYFSARPPFQPAEGIRRLVRFERRDLLGNDYPTGSYHVIICRNVLIYFDRPVQENVLQSLHDSLVPGGFLVLGKVESLLGRTRRSFEPVAQRERIYRRIS